MPLSPSTSPIHKPGERGYVLLTLLLAMALLVIATALASSSIAFRIRRDREEELIHRGVQYTRAIRQYAKKTGHFPLTLDELDNTNGQRYLRKHYIDPITGKPFKLVYMADVQLGGTASPTSNGAPVTNGSPGFTSGTLNNPNQTTSPTQPGVPSAPQDPPSSSDPANSPDSSGSATNPHPGISATSAQPPRGLIVGVVSGSADQTIRQFSGKNHYNQWRFYYIPAFDQNALINAPTVKPYFQPAPKLDEVENPGQSVPTSPQSPAPPAQARVD